MEDCGFGQCFCVLGFFIMFVINGGNLKEFFCCLFCYFLFILWIHA